MPYQLVRNWLDKTVFSEAGPQPQAVASTDRFKVVLGGLEPGQQLPVHPEGPSAFCFLEGHGWMTVDQERFRIEVGSVVVLPEGGSRGIEAESPLAFLAVRLPM